MSNLIDYKSTRWFKCDLHLHTPASKCFQDRTVTPEQWVQRAIEKGLHFVAVTDHNTGDMIDAIKRAAEGKGLTVSQLWKLPSIHPKFICWFYLILLKPQMILMIFLSAAILIEICLLTS